jgi:hypothetical protein
MPGAACTIRRRRLTAVAIAPLPRQMGAFRFASETDFDDDMRRADAEREPGRAANRRDHNRRTSPMLGFIWKLYTAGIVVCFILFLIFVPSIPLGDAVLSAVLWPWGVYEHFIAASPA